MAREFQARAEQCGAALPIKAAAELLSHALEPGGGDRCQVALGEFGIEAAQLLGKSFEPFVFGSEGAIREILPLDGAEVLDEMLVLAAPENEGALSHSELFGDASEADALGAQLNKFLNGFCVFHKDLSGSLQQIHQHRIVAGCAPSKPMPLKIAFAIYRRTLLTLKKLPGTRGPWNQ